MKNVGFSGTQQGMTVAQKQMVYASLKEEFEEGARFHHGDCIGADSEAHDLARVIGYKVVSHPPYIRAKRAYRTAHFSRNPRPYMERNQDIVNECEVLVFAPFSTEGKGKYSGTWATLRRARKADKRRIVCWPDGNVSTERNAADGTG